MPELSTLPEREVFVEWVHDVLTHLYDSQFLNRHPLAVLVAGSLPDGMQRSQALRRLLVDTMRTLRPAAGTPAQSPDWRTHQILELRYIEGLSPAEVMERLALSKSHYFREQTRVVEAVAAILWDDERVQAVRAAAAQSAVEAVASTVVSITTAESPSGDSRSELAQIEVERLLTHATWETIDVAELLAELQPVIALLVAANDATLHAASTTPFRIPHASRALLRQAILNTATYAADMAPGGALSITPIAHGAEAGFALCAQRADDAGRVATTQRQGVGLEVAHRLLEAMEGRLTVVEEASSWEARLLWRNGAPSVLLVVDDNLEFVDLIRRYLAGQPWQVLGAAGGRAARQILATQSVSTILLDVMMPEEDGWELLRALRSAEATRSLPVIVCSVLNEPRLAQMLGATAYLPKPLSQQALLATLAAQDANPATTH